jgi:hypothetical protein
MSSGFLMYVTLGLALAVAGLLAWVIAIQVRLSRLHRQYARLMTGVDGGDLQEVLDQHIAELRSALESVSALEKDTQRIDRTLKHAMQWNGVVRYNAFRNTGGDQSFTWALADGYGNGVVLSSLHARENTRVYAKPLYGWESPYSLTEEEEQAIAQAADQDS